MGNNSSTNKNEKSHLKSVAIGQMTGGLGNQLFIIAATYAYCKRYDKRFYLTHSWKDVSKDRPDYWNNILSFFKHNNNLVFNSQIKKIQSYTYSSIEYKEIPKINSNILLKGYFQSHKYFEDYNNEIKELLSLPEHYKKIANIKLSKFKEETIVAVHIRRGDYTKYPGIYHLLSVNYYNSSKKILEEKLGFRPIYLYFSNDKDWVRKNFTLEDKDEIIEEPKDYIEFSIMSQCHHFIIANSTFSWWAAYLSDTLERVLPKIVIAPENWYGEKWTEKWDDIYPEGWIRVRDYIDGYFEGSNQINSINLDSKSWRDDILVDNNMEFKRYSNEKRGRVIFKNNLISLIFNNDKIENIKKGNTDLDYFIQKQNEYIENRIHLNTSSHKYNSYVINLKSREDRRKIFIENFKDYDINISFFDAIEHNKGYIGCGLSHLYLIQYAKYNNLPYIIVFEDDSKLLINNEDFVRMIDILINNLDKWEIFNGCPSFWDKRNNINSLNVINSFNGEFVNVNWGQSTSFMIYNQSSYDKMLSYKFKEQIDQFISITFIQTIYKDKPVSIQLSSYSNVGNTNTTKNYENFFIQQYDIIKKKKIISQKKIGIYSIFIGKYEIFYENFIKNVEENFYPGFTKYYYIISDNINLPKYNDRTFIFNTERIGWPYETLYRFKYLNLFNEADLNKSDYLFFINSNGKFTNIIYDEMINYDYAFTIHNGYINKSYKDLSYEKNPKSFAYIENEPNFNFKYFAGGFYGAKTDLHIKMSKEIDDYITKDEKNNYIAIWHDESHLNKYAVSLIKNKNDLYEIDTSYHIAEENIHKHKNIKINLIYLNKSNYIKQSSDVKNMKNGKLNTNGKIILNKYNKDLII